AMSKDATVRGQPLPRIEGRSKVTGSARYAADHLPENCAHAYGVTSSIASGEVVSIDVSGAESAPGVVAVLHLGETPGFFRCPEDVSVGERRPPLEDRRVHYGGQFVAVVVAETFEQARAASRFVKVDYREERAVTR